MGEWDRQTPWRQGLVLKAETVAALRLVPEANNSDSLIVVVISHDCDIAQDPNTEPVVEAIVGQRVAGANGNFTNGKNPRRLHLTASEGGKAVCIEMVASARLSIPKQELAEHAPDAAISFSSAELNRMQFWLATRYRRSAFPDEFDRRLSDRGVAKRLAKILEPLGNYIIAVFFDIDEGEEIAHLNEDDPFTLSIALLYSTEADPLGAEAAAQEAAKAIAAAFGDRCFDTKTNKWQAIEFLGCEPIADEALTYAMSLKLKRWNADHISLRAEPAQPVISD